MAQSFLRGDLLSLVDALTQKLDGEFRQRCFDVCECLLDFGLVHALDEFQGFEDFASGDVKLFVHRKYSGPLLLAGSADPVPDPVPPGEGGGVPVKGAEGPQACPLTGGARPQELRLDISLHK